MIDWTEVRRVIWSDLRFSEDLSQSCVVAAQQSQSPAPDELLEDEHRTLAADDIPAIHFNSCFYQVRYSQKHMGCKASKAMFYLWVYKSCVSLRHFSA